MNKITVVLVLFLLHHSFIALAQSELKEIPLSQQIKNSSLVLEGKVLSKRSFWDANKHLIYTAHTVEVYKIFKGKYMETVEVITLGGTVGLEALHVSTSLKLREGQIGVFMLYKTSRDGLQEKTNTAQYQPYSASQGFYKYDLYDDLVSNPFGKRHAIKTAFYKDLTDETLTDYLEVKKFDTALYSKQSGVQKILAPSISNFSPTTASAGTESVLTINGSGFGTTPGTVSFANAEVGTGYVDALDTQIQSWTNTRILVEIPSFAGTGSIRVSMAGASDISSGILTIAYAEANVSHEGNAYKVQHYGQYNNSGYQWQMQTSFFNNSENPGARAAFERAFETWRCTTGINWVLSNVATTTDVASGGDNVNVIRFDNGSELDAGVLGACYSYSTGCNIGSTIEWYISGMDLVFDGGADWNFGSGVPSQLGYDFQSVALHELGHAHQLGHVNDTNDLMNWSIGLQEVQRDLGSNNIVAAKNVQARSTSGARCGLSPMTNYAGSCFLNLAEDALTEALILYPNPVKNQLIIESIAAINLLKASLYDVNGRLILTYDISRPATQRTLDLQHVAKGLYLLKITSDVAEVTKKILVH